MKRNEVRFTLRLPLPLRDRLKSESEKRYLSINTLIVQSIMEWIKKNGK